MTGAVGQRRVPTGYFSERLVPIPPTKEQLRIVEKIEELFSELDKGIENLNSALEQLKVYRHAVLKHALEGRLTAEWRKQNEEKLDDPDQLLQKLQLAREVRYEQQLTTWKVALKQWQATGRTLTKPTKPAAPKPIADVSSAAASVFPLLPKGWAYVRLGYLVDEPAYGTSKRCNYECDGIGVLRIPNVAKGVIDALDLKFANFDQGEIEAYRLQAGDILTIRSNGSVSLVGRCALISADDARYLFAGYLIRVRPNPAVANSQYLLTALSSHQLRSQIEGKAKSTSGVHNINSGEIQDLIVPICSPEEQLHLMDRLSEILSAIDATETEIEAQLSRAEALRQSILRRAYSGRLVRQDPNDESANALLERLSDQSIKKTNANRKEAA